METCRLPDALIKVDTMAIMFLSECFQNLQSALVVLSSGLHSVLYSMYFKFRLLQCYTLCILYVDLTHSMYILTHFLNTIL